eukprot:6202108-Pleurochrysis_carterae.AAC.1
MHDPARCQLQVTYCKVMIKKGSELLISIISELAVLDTMYSVCALIPLVLTLCSRSVASADTFDASLPLLLIESADHLNKSFCSARKHEFESGTHLHNCMFIPIRWAPTKRQTCTPLGRDGRDAQVAQRALHLPGRTRARTRKRISNQ